MNLLFEERNHLPKTIVKEHLLKKGTKNKKEASASESAWPSADKPTPCIFTPNQPSADRQTQRRD
jgi:hypothetical protein